MDVGLCASEYLHARRKARERKDARHTSSTRGQLTQTAELAGRTNLAAAVVAAMATGVALLETLGSRVEEASAACEGHNHCSLPQESTT